MFKKFLMPLLILSMVFFLQCKDDHILPNQDQNSLKAGKGGGGGGGHTEVLINNLSFPVLLADGVSVSPVTTAFSTPYTGAYEGLSQEEIDWIEENGYGDENYWYAQKVEGNVWQADYETVSSASVTFVDWGDAIEAVDPKVGRPYRLELALYKDVSQNPMTAYTMTVLAFPSSPDETQGTNQLTYESDWAVITSPKGRIVVQRFDDGATLTWNGSSWNGAYAPEAITFSTELNVGGKYIFGASKKGWKPKAEGNYRITFYMDASVVDFAGAQVGNYLYPNPEIGSEAENNQPYVDAENNLTYVDVQAAGGGGGGRH